MLAMVLKQVGRPLVLEEVPDPKPGPRQALIKVLACGVCRTDLHVCDGELKEPKLPLIPGHEIVGVVTETGPEVNLIRVGDRVAVPWLGDSCGECLYCFSDQENLCDWARFTGYQIDGGYAEFTVADERFCFPVPDLYSDIDAAPLVCAGMIGYRSLRFAGAGDRLGIFGFGAAAHIVAQTARSQHRRIFAFTRPGDTEAQDFARSLGAEWAGDSESRPAEELDAALIFAPIGSLVPNALRSVRKGGTVVCAGIHMSDIPSFGYSLLWGERVLRSVANLTRSDAREFLALAPQVPITTVTQVFPLHEANTALDRLRSGKLTGAAVLVPSWSAAKPILPRATTAATHAPSAAQPAWFDSLQKPETFPHPVSDIQLSETHISWIVRTGEWTYKLKKPVDFGFVNFTTLERRLSACQDEIRLNRRTAPELYDGVVALTQDDSGPRFGGTGTPLEYAVRMRQFEQQNLLEAQLKRHELTPALMTDLAHEVARLHQRAEVAPVESDYGARQVTLKAIQECEQALQQSSVSDADRTILNDISHWIAGESDRLQQTFSERKFHGWIRECHGDLHLGNVVVFNGKPTLFDCLEFNAQLRWIDVISDLAFLFMDLHDHHASDLAWCLLNVWLEEMGDFTGLRVLRFYAVYRALVRAKVAALRLRQPDLSDQERDEQQQRLAGYLNLASHLTTSHHVSMILMHGVSGSGKSFVARNIATSLGMVQLRSDIERKRLPASADQYSPQAIKRTYERLRSLTRDVIQAGYSVVVDATFARREERLSFMTLAQQLQVPVVIVDCTAPEYCLRERVTQRAATNRDPSEANISVLENQLRERRPLDDIELPHTVTVDTSVAEFDDIAIAIQERIKVITAGTRRTGDQTLGH